MLTLKVLATLGQNVYRCETWNCLLCWLIMMIIILVCDLHSYVGDVRLQQGCILTVLRESAVTDIEQTNCDEGEKGQGFPQLDETTSARLLFHYARGHHNTQLVPKKIFKNNQKIQTISDTHKSGGETAVQELTKVFLFGCKDTRPHKQRGSDFEGTKHNLRPP